MSAAILPPTAVPSGNTFYYTNTGLYVFTNIPSVTAVPNTVLVESLTSYNTPVPGFVLNTPLKGWDYNLGQVNRYSLLSNSGAKPYWTCWICVGVAIYRLLMREDICRRGYF